MAVEWHDKVDDNDNVIGKITREEINTTDTYNFRVVNMFIKNSKGQLWTPRRVKSKRTFPDALDFAVGGHVDMGETYEEALVRETMEELNIELDMKHVHKIGRLTPADGRFAFMNIYEYETDEDPRYNPQDFSGFEWLSPQELVDRIESGDKAKSDIAPIVRSFYIDQ